MYLCIIYLAFGTPWFPRSVYVLKCFMYSGILTCTRVIYNCMHSTEQQLSGKTTGATRVCWANIINQDR